MTVHEMAFWSSMFTVGCLALAAAAATFGLAIFIAFLPIVLIEPVADFMRGLFGNAGWVITAGTLLFVVTPVWWFWLFA